MTYASGVLVEEYLGGKAKCKTLAPAEADKLFFPSSGGKKNKADSFCADCPVLAECLTDAIKNNLKGFFAGTTEDERKSMAQFQGLAIAGLPLPPEPERKKRVYRKIVESEDPYSWLDSSGPTEEEVVAAFSAL